MNKKVLRSFDIDTKKEAKTAVSTNYQELHPAWGISFLDIEGQWGYQSFNETFEVSISKASLDEVCNNDSLFDVLSEFEGKEFSSLKAFFNKLATIDGWEAKYFPVLSDVIKKSYFIKELYPKLKSYESNTWREIEEMKYGSRSKTKNHPISIDRLSKEAKERLKELKYDDLDEIYSLRLTGKLRVFGKREHNILHIIWVDQGHDVCPCSND